MDKEEELGGGNPGGRTGSRARDDDRAAGNGTSDHDGNSHGNGDSPDTGTDPGSVAGDTGSAGYGDRPVDAGSDPRRRSRRSRRRTGSDETETPLLQEVGEPDPVLFKGPTKARSHRRVNTKDKITVAAVAQSVSLGFGLIGMTKDPRVQAAWIVSPEECKPAAEPLAACLGGLPEHVLSTALNLINPVAAGAALWAIYNMCQSREAALVQEILIRQQWAKGPQSSGYAPPSSNGTSGAGEPSSDGAFATAKPQDLPYE